LDEESRKRVKVQEELNSMQKTYLIAKQNPNVEQLKKITEKAEQAINIADQVSATDDASSKNNSPTSTVAAQLAETKNMTRVEREMELLNLKKQLEIEKGELKRLRDIAEEAKSEVARALEMASQSPAQVSATGKHLVPTWVKLLNENTKRSDTIRVKAKQKAKDAIEAGAVMNFKDKLLFFTSSPLEQGKLNK
jgi:DNA invertase Pin-like site-specific DNA recombinase